MRVSGGSRHRRCVRNRNLRAAGYVETETLAALYRDAELLVFPSLAEGFGLPVVEAMALGCPVITTDIPALREVAGGAAIHLPPGDSAAFIRAARALLTRF